MGFKEVVLIKYLSFIRVVDMFKVGGYVIVRLCCFIRLYLLVLKVIISLEGDYKI